MVKKTTAIETVLRDQERLTLLTKINAIPPNKKNKNILGDMAAASHTATTNTHLKKLSETIGHIKQLFPELDYSSKLLTAMILNPKDLTSKVLSYKTSPSKIPAVIINELLAKTSTYIEAKHHISKDMYTMLKDAKFDKGAVAKLVLAESSIDQIINRGIDKGTKTNYVTMEGDGTIKINAGYNGTATNSKADAIKVLDDVVSVTTDTNILKIPQVVEQVTLEHDFISIVGEKDNSVVDLLKETPYEKEDIIYVEDRQSLKRDTIGTPMVLDVPIGSISVLHVPGNPKKHIGYFIAADSNGYILNNSAVNISEVTSGVNFDVIGNDIITKAATELQGSSETLPEDTNMGKLFSDLMDQKLIKVLEGTISSNMAIDSRSEFYYHLLSRALQKKGTRLIYVPVSNLAYIAMDYHDNGVGKSVYEDMLVLLSLRAMLLFSGVNSEIQSNISLTELDVEFDEDDPDAGRTLEEVGSTYLKTRQMNLPVGILAPEDLTNWQHKAGVFMKFSSLPGIDNTKITVNRVSPDIKNPTDTDLNEQLRKSSIQQIGSSPSLVEDGFSSDFASTDEAIRLMLSHTTQQEQEIFLKHINHYVHILINNNGYLLKELKTIIEDNLKHLTGKSGVFKDMLSKENGKDILINSVLGLFVDILYVHLPAADTNSLQILKDDYELYKSCVEDVVNDVWVTEAHAEEAYGGNTGEYAENTKTLLISYFLKNWCSDNGYLQELFVMETDNEDIDFTKELSLDITNITKMISELYKKTRKSIKRTDKVITKASEEEEDPEPTVPVNTEDPITTGDPELE